MKKVLFILIVIFVMLVVTKPGKAQYDNWFKETYLKRNNNFVSSIITDGLLTVFNNQVTALIDSTTKCQNKIIFSIYSTGIGDFNFKAIGLFNHFIILSEPLETKQASEV